MDVLQEVRAGVLMAVTNSNKKPDHLVTSFAGFDIEAIETLRQHLLPYPPSSPAIALFKDGELVHFIERHQIEVLSIFQLVCFPCPRICMPVDPGLLQSSGKIKL